jgi:hypothetical protein
MADGILVAVLSQGGFNVAQVAPPGLRFEPAGVQESRPWEGEWEIDWNLSRADREERA